MAEVMNRDVNSYYKYCNCKHCYSILKYIASEVEIKGIKKFNFSLKVNEPLIIEVKCRTIKCPHCNEITEVN